MCSACRFTISMRTTGSTRTSAVGEASTTRANRSSAEREVLTPCLVAPRGSSGFGHMAATTSLLDGGAYQPDINGALKPPGEIVGTHRHREALCEPMFTSPAVCDHA